MLEIVQDTRDFGVIAADTRFYLLIATAVVVLVAAGLGFFVARGLSRPVMALTGAMNSLSSGDMNVEIPGNGRVDEIGTMAKAVDVFKRSMLDAERLRAEREASSSAPRPTRRR